MSKTPSSLAPLALLVPALLVLSAPAVGQSPMQAPAQVPAARPAASPEALIARANTSLRAAATARGRFSQVDPDGSTSTGTFYLRRPGRMRFAYDAPSPLLVVADGSTVAVSDSALETIDRAPLSSTPLGLFLGRNPDLNRDAEVVTAQVDRGTVYVRLRDRTGETDGELILLFRETDFQLTGWWVVDAQNNFTQVSLSDVVLNPRLDPRLFLLRGDERERR
jgi:outer membrane lipoprotein-sorting protein